MPSKTDVQLATERLYAVTSALSGLDVYLDVVPAANPGVALAIRYVGLAAPLDYAFGGDYDWADLLFQLDVSAVTADYDDATNLLWTHAAAIQSALQNYRYTGSDGRIHDTALAVPFQQAEVAPGEHIKRAGAVYQVKAKAT